MGFGTIFEQSVLKKWPLPKVTSIPSRYIKDESLILPHIYISLISLYWITFIKREIAELALFWHRIEYYLANISKYR